MRKRPSDARLEQALFFRRAPWARRAGQIVVPRRGHPTDPVLRPNGRASSAADPEGHLTHPSSPGRVHLAGLDPALPGWSVRLQPRRGTDRSRHTRSARRSCSQTAWPRSNLVMTSAPARAWTTRAPGGADPYSQNRPAACLVRAAGGHVSSTRTGVLSSSATQVGERNRVGSLRCTCVSTRSRRSDFCCDLRHPLFTLTSRPTDQWKNPRSSRSMPQMQARHARQG